MPYCPKCHVYLAPQAHYCPLCREPAVAAPDASPPATEPIAFTEAVRNADEKEPLSPRDKRMMAFELLCVSFALILTVTLSVDFLNARALTWSRFTSLLMVMLWLSSALPLVLWGHPWLLYAALGPSLVVGIFLWSVFSAGLYWFLPLGLPLSLLLEAAVVTDGVLIAVQKRKGLNSFAVVLATIAVICLGIDLTISLFTGSRLLLSWSLVVAISFVPLSGLFFYLHYRVMNRASLRKLFRL